MKKIAVTIMIFTAVCFAFYCANKETYVEDDVHNRVIYNLEDVVANPDNYPDYSIEIFDSNSEYINTIIKDENVNSDIKLNLQKSENEENIVYARYKDTVAVTNKYSISPYYYIKFITENGKIIGIDCITAAAIDFQCGDKKYSFSGSMLYLNESTSAIYQNIYGNFYRKGETTVRQAATETLMKIVYTFDTQEYPDNSVAFSTQRGVYFQFK